MAILNRGALRFHDTVHGILSVGDDPANSPASPAKMDRRRRSRSRSGGRSRSRRRRSRSRTESTDKGKKEQVEAKERRRWEDRMRKTALGREGVIDSSKRDEKEDVMKMRRWSVEFKHACYQSHMQDDLDNIIFSFGIVITTTKEQSKLVEKSTWQAVRERAQKREGEEITIHYADIMHEVFAEVLSASRLTDKVEERAIIRAEARLLWDNGRDYPGEIFDKTMGLVLVHKRPEVYRHIASELYMIEQICRRAELQRWVGDAAEGNPEMWDFNTAEDVEIFRKALNHPQVTAKVKLKPRGSSRSRERRRSRSRDRSPRGRGGSSRNYYGGDRRGGGGNYSSGYGGGRHDSGGYGRQSGGYSSQGQGSYGRRRSGGGLRNRGITTTTTTGYAMGPEARRRGQVKGGGLETGILHLTSKEEREGSVPPTKSTDPRQVPIHSASTTIKAIGFDDCCCTMDHKGRTPLVHEDWTKMSQGSVQEAFSELREAVRHGHWQ
eukprot:g38027.t1